MSAENTAKESQSEFDKLLDHEYDGIREYDNPLPSWWTTMFILSILFSVGYWTYYHMGGAGVSATEAYAAAYDEWSSTQQQVTVDEPTLTKLQHDPAALAAAKKLFVTHCTACHKPDGSGLVGPNLTDDYQLHGSARVDIFKTIRDGVPAKGMIAWGKMLRGEEVINLAAYVASLRHTNVAGGKAPQGDKVKPWQ